MRFSLIITTYNSERYINEAIDSALNQVRKPDEIIICDDNSTDNTISICNKYKESIRIHVNKNGPSGYTNAFNYALKLGTGDYVTILHYDDILMPGFFQNAEDAFSRYPNSKFLITRNFYFQDGEKLNAVSGSSFTNNLNIKLLTGREYALAYLRSASVNDHINRCPGTVFHRSLVDKIYFREQAGLISDDDLFYRVGQYTDVIRVNTPLAGVRYHTSSETGKLRPLNCSKQLAQSYYFLAKDRDSYSLLGREGRDYFLTNLAKFNFRTLYWSVIEKNKNETLESIALNVSMNNSFDQEIKNHSKYYHRIFFFFAKNRMMLLNMIIFRMAYYFLTPKMKN